MFQITGWLTVMYRWILRTGTAKRRTWLILFLICLAFSFYILFCWEKGKANHQTRHAQIEESWKPWELHDLKAPAAYINDVIHDKRTAVKDDRQIESKNSEKELTTQQVKSQRLDSLTSSDSFSSGFKQRRDRICGQKWQKSYKKLHREILDSRRRQQFIVFTCKEEGYTCSGYGNRLGAIASLLFLSVLTKRAFLIEWDVDVHVPLEFYFVPNAVAWNYSVDNLQIRDTRTHFWGLRRKPIASNRTDVIKIADTKEDFISWLQNTDFQSYFDRRVEKVVGSWYFAEDLWQNKFLKKRALELGISSDRPNFSLIGCAFDFLFQKSRQFQARLDVARTSLGLTRQAPKIGLHVRMGDIFLGYLTIQYIDIDYKDFFDCAQALTETLARRSRDVFRKEDIRWFLATDDNKVKTYALKNYPFNAVTQIITPQHIKRLKQLTHSESVEVMYDVLVDHFLLAECDFLILTGQSTFGKTAAGLMFHSEAAFMFNAKRCR